MAPHHDRYYASHKDIIKERQRLYYIANRDMIRDRQTKYYQKIKGQNAYIRPFPPKWRALESEAPQTDFNVGFE